MLAQHNHNTARTFVTTPHFHNYVELGVWSDETIILTKSEWPPLMYSWSFGCALNGNQRAVVHYIKLSLAQLGPN